MNTDSVDPRVVGGGEAMAVFGFSDSYETPMLAGNTRGIGRRFAVQATVQTAA